MLCHFYCQDTTPCAHPQLVLITLKAWNGARSAVSSRRQYLFEWMCSNYLGTVIAINIKNSTETRILESNVDAKKYIKVSEKDVV